MNPSWKLRVRNERQHAKAPVRDIPIRYLGKKKKKKHYEGDKILEKFA